MPPRQPSEVPRGKAAVPDVYTAMRASILDGEIAPGTRINIDAVARSLGVSQTPVREVLQRLEGDNLVVYNPGRGYSTTPLLDLPELRSLFEFRLLVEPWAARAAAVDRLANPAGTLERELAGFRDAMKRSRDLRQDLVAHDTRFHDTILAASGNPVVRHAFAQTHCHLHTFRLYPADVDGAITVAEHTAVREAIEACDPERAEAAMTTHIRNSFDRFAKAFEGELAPLEDSGPPRRRIVTG
ncbi:GntR family transcriptional regulator [Arthrobacter sp. SLBN-122]|uniref:GntR family transcriptional regulator n=1 Tax=Arthrobacter sp. SLBN-122 TaxID=2768455 RepID=UPI00116EA552|nr:GntR family transcriptional regulator [Arthrobacter sp. SLBN-122]TQJ33742.1 DNA-binding GntR family transcriptional regulator [Arthrobacter sp. SLBN-122]